MKRILILLVCVQFGFAEAQELNQQVTGRVEDKMLHTPLAGASLLLLHDSLSIGTLSDATGSFVFKNVFPGRYLLRISFTGYESVQQEVLIISARKTDLTIQLQQSQNVLDEVEIVSSRNALPEPGLQTITIEKALRMPANFFDPVRVITSYPGVMTANDQNNTIVIRGNSPAGLLWRINGLDVVNPNHLANAGTFSDKPAAYGGGVNIISSQLIDKTDFYSGALPAKYGNALSGVVDMKLREGDQDDAHYTAQASLLGLDLAAEGPIKKNSNTSYLVNYRYSTVGLLSQLGVKFGDEDISFQDLTFSLNSKLSKGRSISWFGFYGTSKNVFKHKDSVDWEVDKDQYDIKYSSRNFGTGLTFNQAIRNVNIASGIAVSNSRQKRDQSPSPQLEADRPEIIYADNFDVDKVLVSAFARVTAKLDFYYLESGIMVNYGKDDINQHDESGNALTETNKGSVEGMLLQPYAQWKMILSDRWIAQTAMRYVYYTYNNTGAIEPRVSIEYFPSVKSNLKFSYNLVSQQQQAGIYLNGSKNLELSKSHHLDLGYGYTTSNGFQFSSTVYYQKLFDVPVSEAAPSYSAINSIEINALPELVSKGTGTNYGAELLAEKAFFDKSYVVAGVSYYKSEYEGFDKITRSTRFDGNYAVNVTYGREWSNLKKQSFRTFGVSSRILYLGGLKESPIDVSGSATAPSTVYNESKAFENKLKDYFRLDLRLSWKKNRKNYTRTLALDIQNLFNVQNEAYHYYDHVKGKINTQYQLGLIPVLVYRVDF